MRKALTSAYLLCGYIIDDNVKRKIASEHGVRQTQLDFVIRHDKTFLGVEVLVNRLFELTQQDIELIYNANDILKGEMTITKTGEISVKFQDS